MSAPQRHPKHNDTSFKPGNTVAAATSTYTDEIGEMILTSVRAGALLETAAGYAGVPSSTFFAWVKKGRRERREPYATFVDKLDQAIAENEMSNLAFISAARKESWQSAAWLLERRYPERYGRRTRVDGNVTVTAQPFIDTAKLSADELDTLVSLLEKARPDVNDPALGVDGKPASDLLEIEAADEADEAEEGEWEETESAP